MYCNFGHRLFWVVMVDLILQHFIRYYNKNKVPFIRTYKYQQFSNQYKTIKLKL